MNNKETMKAGILGFLLGVSLMYAAIIVRAIPAGEYTPTPECLHAEQTYIGNKMCYRDQTCLMLADAFVNQIIVTDYLLENCPNEWEAIKVPTPPVKAETPNTGNGVGPEVQAGKGRDYNYLFPTP